MFASPQKLSTSNPLCDHPTSLLRRKMLTTKFYVLSACLTAKLRVPKASHAIKKI